MLRPFHSLGQGPVPVSAFMTPISAQPSCPVGTSPVPGCTGFLDKQEVFTTSTGTCYSCTPWSQQPLILVGGGVALLGLLMLIMRK